MWPIKPTKKGKGFTQPLQPHEHWHIDVSYINIQGPYIVLSVKPVAKFGA
jgi:putative transposase